MKNMRKIIYIAIVITLMFVNFAYAEYVDPTVGMKFQVEDSDQLNGIFSAVLGVAQVIGAIVIVVTIIIAGIKYMVSSIDEKASIKQKAVPVVIGAVLIFSSATLLKWIAGFVTETLSE